LLKHGAWLEGCLQAGWQVALVSVDIDPFDLDAAILRKNEGDMRSFLTALAARLDQALPGRITIERKRDGLFSSSTHVVRIELATDNAAYAISLDRTGVKTTRAKVVRGVTISNVPIPAKAWIDEVRASVATLSGASDKASDVIGGFL
jgi:hypothetical protein